MPKTIKKIAILLLITMSSTAQNAAHEFLVWPQLIVRSDPEQKFSYEGIFQARFLENKNLQLAALTNGVYIKPSKEPLYYGFDYTFIVAESGNDYRQVHWLQPKIEFRPKVSNINFFLRLMYAHLWIYELNSEKFKAEDNRIRLLYQASLPVMPNIRLTINDEFFVLGRSSWMRENRFQFALSKKMDDRNTISVGYFYRWIGSTSEISTTKYENAVTVVYIHSFFAKK